MRFPCRILVIPLIPMNLLPPIDVETQRRNHALLEAELHRLTSETIPPSDDFATTSAEPLTFSPYDLSHPYLHPYLLPLNDSMEDEFLSCQVNHAGDRVANTSCFNTWNVTPSPTSDTTISSPTSSSSSTTYSSKAGPLSSAFSYTTRQHAAISAAAATAARILQNQKILSSQHNIPDHPMILTYSPSRATESKRPRSPSQLLQLSDTDSTPGSPVSSHDREESLTSGQDSAEHGGAKHDPSTNDMECEDESSPDTIATSDDEVMNNLKHQTSEKALTSIPKPVPVANSPGRDPSAKLSHFPEIKYHVLPENGSTEDKTTKLPPSSPTVEPKVVSRDQKTLPPFPYKEGVNTNDTSKDAALLSVRQRRAEAMERFKRKKALRCYGRRVRYQIRKRIATTRPRVNGRFARRSDVGAVIAVSSSSLASASELTPTPISTSDENESTPNKIT